MGLLMRLRGERQVRLNHRHRHDVEDAAGVGVFRIGQLLVTATLVVGRLNLAVDLTAVGAFEVDRGRRDAPGRCVRMTGSADFLLGDLLDVEGFLVS